MKLLLDENLSPKLPRLLSALFPESMHVRECGLLGLPDEDVWEHARIHGFMIISKDSDFQQRSFLYGHSPKIIWLRIGNCTRQQLVQLITRHEQEICGLHTSPFQSMLIRRRRLQWLQGETRLTLCKSHLTRSLSLCAFSFDRQAKFHGLARHRFLDKIIK